MTGAPCHQCEDDAHHLERQGVDPLAAADLANARHQARHDLAQHQARRAARRDLQPMPEGGLFDDVRRHTQELF